MHISRRHMLCGLAAAPTLALPAIGRAATALTKITLLHSGISPYLGAFYAQDEGIFRALGLDVEIMVSPNGSTEMAALVSNSAQIALPTPTVFLQAVESGIDAVAVAGCNVYPDNIRSGLLARIGADIHTAKDLEGKRVGVPGIGGLLDVLLRRWAAANGANLSRIHFVEVSLPQAPDLLRNGQIDAAAAAEPIISRAISLHAATLVADYMSGLPDGTTLSFYTALRSWALANRPVVAAFQTAIARAVADIPQHPDRARQALAHYTHLPMPVLDALPLPNLHAHISAAQIAPWIQISRDQQVITNNPDPSSLVLPWTGEN